MTNNTSQLSTEHRAQSTEPLLYRLKVKLKSVSFIYYLVRCVKVTLFHLWKIIWPLIWQVYKNFVRFNRNGLNKTEHRDKKIIVSLTSYPARINIVPYVIASLLNQTMKPDKIILWLGEDKFPDKKLPKIYEKVKACGVDIEFREDLGPHTKYFYSMQEYPDDIIITFDDDLMYNSNVIETLYKSHVKHPACISAMRVLKINFLPDGSIAKYWSWDWFYHDFSGRESHQYFFMGVGGVLYPPHLLNKELFNVNAIKKLCYKEDDAWLNAMAVINDVKAVIAYGENYIPGIGIPGSQENALWKTNVSGGENNKQIKAILDVYNNWPLEKTGKTILELMNEGI